MTQSRGIPPHQLRHLPEIQPLSAREFCRKMHGLDGRPLEEIFDAEVKPGYKKRCVRLLSKVLKLKPGSIQNWGGLAFEKMPQNYSFFLGYYYQCYSLMHR